jgi:hypothetical protein
VRFSTTESKTLKYVKENYTKIGVVASSMGILIFLSWIALSYIKLENRTTILKELDFIKTRINSTNISVSKATRAPNIRIRE